jgi:hypothetical protein
MGYQDECLKLEFKDTMQSSTSAKDNPSKGVPNEMQNQQQHV